MDDDGWDQLVGDIYAAATDDAGWTALPDRVRGVFGASMCALWSASTLDGQPAQDLVSTMPPEFGEAYAEHFYAIDPWRVGEHRAPWDRVVAGAALIEDAALARSPYYADFGRLYDTFHLVGTRHQLSAHDQGFVSKVALMRPRGMDPFSAAETALLDRLGPHLRRAWQMRSQLGAASGQATLRAAWADGLAATLAALPGAALAVDAHGRIHRANPVAERLPREPGARRETGLDGVLHPATAAERLRLHAALAAAARGEAGDAMMLEAGQQGARRVTVTPLRPRNGTPPGLALVLVTPAALGQDAQTVSRARQLFGLSQAEAEVMLHLADGSAPAAVADARQVSVATVRTQLQRAQAKMGANDLRGLVAMATLLRGA